MLGVARRDVLLLELIFNACEMFHGLIPDLIKLILQIFIMRAEALVIFNKLNQLLLHHDPLHHFLSIGSSDAFRLLFGAGIMTGILGF